MHNSSSLSLHYSLTVYHTNDTLSCDRETVDSTNWSQLHLSFSFPTLHLHLFRHYQFKRMFSFNARLKIILSKNDVIDL